MTDEIREMLSLHHRIWELVTMICAPKEQAAAATDKTVRADHEAMHEAEISRLTWAVLDGKATEAERRRLAELVNAQHEQRGA